MTTRNILIAIAAAAVFLTVAVIQYRNSVAADALYRAEKARIERELKKTADRAAEAERAREAAKALAEAAAERELRAREMHEQEISAKERQISRLSGEIEFRRDEAARETAETALLDDSELAARAAETLASTFPDIDPPPLIQDGLPNRSFFTAANLATIEIGLLRFTNKKHEEMLEAKDQMLAARLAQVESWQRQNEALQEQCDTCERALEARRAHEANLQQMIEAQTDRVEDLERRAFWNRLKSVGFTGAAFGAGFAVGRAVD